MSNRVSCCFASWRSLVKLTRSYVRRLASSVVAKKSDSENRNKTAKHNAIDANLINHGQVASSYSAFSQAFSEKRRRRSWALVVGSVKRSSLSSARRCTEAHKLFHAPGLSVCQQQVARGGSSTSELISLTYRAQRVPDSGNEIRLYL